MTHAQNFRTFSTWADVVGLVEGDRYLVVAPFFHAFGLKAGWLACLLRGAVIVPLATLDPARVREVVQAERITVLPGPPAVYQTLLEQGGLSGASLRLAVTGAANVPVELVRRMRDELGFRDVLTAYGLTECCGVATMCRREDDLDRVASTCGRAIPGVALRVVGADGAELPSGEAGEVEVSGYNVLSGYVDDPAATSAALHDGWLRTGDLGVLDADGYLRIVDRLKDLVIVGGFKVAPAEVEAVLRRHPAIADVAVVGAPDARLGEVTVAFYVARGSVTSDELWAFSREHMANFKVPRSFVPLDALPRNAGGKVLKTELRRGLVDR
jgi:acyl-CoA synthetase (AMP-forming)/AMP-acid ligase II